MRPKLTIGMPMYHDYHGAWFSLQSLRLNENLENVELIVIDNDPTYAGSNLLKPSMISAFKHHTAGTRYIEYTDAVGPANTKNRVFEEASGEIVLCIDSHVLFRHGTIGRLLEWYDANPESMDLINGPLIYDDLNNISTHFDDSWRGEMWGTWGSAWEAPDGTVFSVRDIGDNTLECFDLANPEIKLPFKGQFVGHEQLLINNGCRKLGLLDSDEFEIPGNGCGLISCRKDAWLGFNKNFRGFGGEEMYIHQKFRNAGQKVLCLGFLKWLHRFGRPEGVAFPLRRWDKVRNYVIGHQELGIPLDRVYDHFVKSGLMKEGEWEAMLSDPIAMTEPQATNKENILDVFHAVKSIPRDLNQHMDKLNSLCKHATKVTEFSERRESLVAFLSEPNVKKIVSYNTEGDNPEVKKMVDMRKDLEITIEKKRSADVPSIDETDLLFIDQRHTYADVYRELSTYGPKTSRFIVLHDTVLYGMQGDDGGPGIGAACKDFMKEHREWSVCAHIPAQHGLTVLCKVPSDKPDVPLRPWLNGGPGTELGAILESLGIKSSPTCDCKAKAREMDKWGIEGCETNREQIIQWIRDNQVRWGWKDKVEAAAASGTEIATIGDAEEGVVEEPTKKMTLREKAAIVLKTITTGLVFKLNVSDPIPSLVDEAIRRAKIKDANGEYV